MNEPFSNARLSAVACGLPVVSSRTNRASEVIFPGKDDAVVNAPGDIESLTDSIPCFLDLNIQAATPVALAKRRPKQLSDSAEQSLERFRQLQA